MKPRLRYRHHVWDCRLPDYRETRVIGYGWTPKQAWNDWALRQAAHLRKEPHPAA